MRTLRILAVLLFGSLLTLQSASAAQISINPFKDNTLYESSTGALSNGAGDYLFAGDTVQGDDSLRRAVLAFDVAGNVPAGSTIDAARLTLYMSRTISGAKTVSLHKLTSDWGEGASDAAGQEGAGGTALTGDATWIHTFYSASTWTAAGGDYNAAATASLTVTNVAPYTWVSSSSMVADVQGWLDSAASNYGWIVIGDEATAGSAKRFDSRENPTAANQPVLTIDYTPIPEPATIGLLLTGLGGVLIARRRRR